MKTLPAGMRLGLLLLLLSVAADAQSFYAMRGFGEPVLAGDARSAALGGLVGSSPLNPAWPPGDRRSSAALSLRGLVNYARCGPDGRVIGSGRPELFRTRFALPWDLRLGLGLTELFNLDFDVYSESLPDYRRRVTGLGGIYDLNVSLARSFFGRVTAALEYDRILGGANEVWRFDAYAGNYVTLDTVTYSFAGNALRAGVYGRFGRLALGGFYEHVLNLTLDSRVRARGSSAESLTVPVRLPPRFGGTLTFGPTERLDLSLSGLVWNAAGITINGRPRRLFRNSLRLAAAAEYRPEDAAPLRLGLHYQDWYIRAAGDTAIVEIGLAGGTGYRLKDLGTLDLALGYARRGATLKENVLRIALSVQLAETWKRRTRNWGY